MNTIYTNSAEIAKVCGFVGSDPKRQARNILKEVKQKLNLDRVTLKDVQNVKKWSMNY